MTWKRLWWFAPLAASALLAVPAATQAADSFTVPVSFTGGSLCGVYEPIAFDGFMHIVYQLRSDPTGNYKELQFANAHYTGVGLVSGDTYVVNAAGHIFEGASDGGTIVSMTEQVERIHLGETTRLDDSYTRVVLSPGGYYIEEDGCG